MPRTVISLDKDDKSWLDQQAKHEHVPMTEIVRRAIRLYRQSVETRTKPDLDELLSQTKGIWDKGDGLEYQRRLRNEWDDRK